MIRVIDMTNDGDHCGECGNAIDLMKRVYRGPGSYLRCPDCQIAAEMKSELQLVLQLVDVTREEP